MEELTPTMSWVDDDMMALQGKITHCQRSDLYINGHISRKSWLQQGIKLEGEGDWRVGVAR